MFGAGIESIDVLGREDNDHERRTEGKYNSAYGMNDMLNVWCNVWCHEMMICMITWWCVCIDTKHDMMYWHEAWHGVWCIIGLYYDIIMYVH